MVICSLKWHSCMFWEIIFLTCGLNSLSSPLLSSPLFSSPLLSSLLLRCWRAVKSFVSLCVQSGGFQVAMSPTMFIPGLTLRVGVCPLLLTCLSIGARPWEELTASDAAICSYCRRETRRRWGFTWETKHWSAGKLEQCFHCLLFFFFFFFLHKSQLYLQRNDAIRGKSMWLYVMIPKFKFVIDGHDTNLFRTFVVPYIHYALLTVSVCKKTCSLKPTILLNSESEC